MLSHYRDELQHHCQVLLQWFVAILFLTYCSQVRMLGISGVESYPSAFYQLDFLTSQQPVKIFNILRLSPSLGAVGPSVNALSKPLSVSTPQTRKLNRTECLLDWYQLLSWCSFTVHVITDPAHTAQPYILPAGLHFVHWDTRGKVSSNISKLSPFYELCSTFAVWLRKVSLVVSLITEVNWSLAPFVLWLA